MSRPTLKTAVQSLGHTRALKDGSVAPQGFDFEFEEVPKIIQAFRRMVRGSEFAVVRPRQTYESLLGGEALPPWLTGHAAVG